MKRQYRAGRLGRSPGRHNWCFVVRRVLAAAGICVAMTLLRESRVEGAEEIAVKLANEKICVTLMNPSDLASPVEGRLIRLGPTAFRHADSLYSVEFSEDGLRILSGADNLGQDDCFTVWDASSGSILARCRLDCGGPGRAAFAPGGKLAAITCYGGVLLWDWQGRRIVRSLDAGTSVRSVAFSPKGRYLAIGGFAGKKLLLWDTANWSVSKQFAPEGESVAGVAFSADGKTVVAAENNPPSVSVWAVASGEMLYDFSPGSTQTRAVVGSRVGNLLAVVTSDQVKLWELGEKRRLVHTLQPQSGEPYGVAFSRDGKQVAVAAWEPSVSLWDARTGKELGRKQTGTWPHAVAFAPCGASLASAGNASICSHRLPDLSCADENSGHTGKIKLVSFLPGSRKLVSLAEDGRLFMWDTQSGKALHRTNEEGGRIATFTVAKDERVIVAGGADGILRFLAMSDLRPIERVKMSAAITSVGACARYVAIGDENGKITVLRLADRKEIARFQTHQSAVDAILFSSDSAMLMTSGQADDYVRWWEAETGRQVRSAPAIARFHGIGASLSLSPSGRFCAMTGSQGWRVLDFETGRRVSPLAVQCLGDNVVFTRDGSGVVAAELGGAVALMDRRTGKRLYQTADAGGYCTCVSMSPDGRKVAAGNIDTTISIWDFVRFQNVMERTRSRRAKEDSNREPGASGQ